jgi:hypothetical protein
MFAKSAFIGRFKQPASWAIAAASLVGGAPALAATQGLLDATSRGSVVINVSVASRTQVSGLTDITLPNVSPSAAITSSQSVCVWSNTAIKAYSVTATGTGQADAFAVSSGTLTAPFSVAWGEVAGQASGTQLTPGAMLTGLTSAASAPTCSSGQASTASLIISFAPGDLQNMQPETTYSGTLNLLVTPG